MPGFLSYVQRLGPASVLAAGAAFLPPFGGIVLLAHINTVGEWLRSHGAQGIAMYVVGFMVCAGVAILPTYASAILGGWAFGFGVGFPAALAGFLGGALIAYGVCRPTAADRVAKLINEKPKWKAVVDALVHGSNLKTLGIVTLLRLPPNSPFALTNLVLASVRVPLWIYLLGTLVGMAPRTAAAVFLASKLQDRVASEVASERPWWVIAAGIALMLVVLGVIGHIANRALAKVTANGRPAPQNPQPAHTPGTS